MSLTQKEPKRTSSTPPPSGKHVVEHTSSNLDLVDELEHIADELATCSVAISSFNVPDLSSMIIAMDRAIARVQDVAGDLHKRGQR